MAGSVSTVYTSTFDAAGNLRSVQKSVDGGAPSYHRSMIHDQMNKMVKNMYIPMTPPGWKDIEYTYDGLGRRVLRKICVDATGGEYTYEYTRYFYDGLKVLCEKTYLEEPGSTGFVCIPSIEEDGESSSEWYVYDTTPSGYSISTVYDTDRKSNVVRLQGTGYDNGFVIGEGPGSLSNPNDDPWNEDDRQVLSMWLKNSGTFYVYAILDTNLGTRYICYKPETGQDTINGSYYLIYIGTSWTDGDWKYFERNVVADAFSLEESGLTSVNEVDGVAVRGSNFYVDDLRLHNAMTERTFTLGAERGWWINFKSRTEWKCLGRHMVSV